MDKDREVLHARRLIEAVRRDLKLTTIHHKDIVSIMLDHNLSYGDIGTTREEYVCLRRDGERARARYYFDRAEETKADPETCYRFLTLFSEFCTQYGIKHATVGATEGQYQYLKRWFVRAHASRPFHKETVESHI